MKKRKQRGFHRDPPWQPLGNAVYLGDPNDPVQNAITDDQTFVGVFKNNLYQVTMHEFESDGAMIVWLIIRRLDSEAVHDWRHLQRIKNELCGPEREAVEVYPAESRLVDTSNQYHLFVLPEGAKVPFGYAERDVSDVPFGANKNRPFDIKPADLNKRIEELDRKVAAFGDKG